MARKPDPLQEFFEDHFRNNPHASIDELAAFVELYGAKPDVNKLINQFHRNIVNRIVRKIKTKDGNRRVFADRKNDIYSDIEQETDLKILANIRKDSDLKYRGNHKTYKFITSRMAELAGQTILEFEQSEISV